MENYKTTLLGLLSTVYEKDETGVAALLNADGSDLKPEALEEILAWDKERVTKLKPDTKKVFDDGYKKAQSEILTSFEKQISEKFGVKSDKKGVELIAEIVEAAKGSKAEGGAGLSEEDVKKHRIYLDAIAEADKKVSAKDQEWQEKYKALESSVEREKTFSEVAKKAIAHFDSLKPILSSDPVKAANQRDLLLRDLSNLQYEIRDGVIVLLDKDGSDLQDGHGKRIPFEKVVKDISDRYFEYQAADPRGNAGNNGTGGGSQIVVPTTDEEFQKAFYNAKTGKEKAELSRLWKERQEKSNP